jgi:cell division septal protein FtsQ
MSSRNYPDRLQFQQRTPNTQASGQVLETFVSQFARYGKVTQTARTEAVRDDQLRSSEGYSIELPRDAAAAAIDTSWRIEWKNQHNETTILNLTGIDASESGRTSKLYLTATR